jgi:branched-chain amino acid transport system ATP-binding protein
MSSEDKISPENGAILEVENISLRFGGARALDDVSFTQRHGEILAVIGPNGAGKTSLLNSITGFYRPQTGRIFFNGQEITHLSPRRIARLSLARTFQNLRLFTASTVLDNLMTGAHMHFKSSFIADCIYFGRSRREDIERRPMIEEIIDFLELSAVRKSVVGTLPYGIRKRVELGRALAMEPRLLMLDEPTAGMSVEEKQHICRNILNILNVKKIPIMMIEHDMGLVMDIASRIIVFEYGKKIAEGTPEEIKDNPDVIRAYLGEAAE